jgi:hypothetical protein
MRKLDKDVHSWARCSKGNMESLPILRRLIFGVDLSQM